MSIGLPGLGWALVSAASIAILAATDPKRRRRTQGAARSVMRLLLLLATFVPGAVLGFAGRWSDFLIWIGASALFGWAIAALFNAWPRPGRSLADRSRGPD
jgi:hypothetical protein